MNDKARYWIDMAEDDLLVAKMMLEGRRYLWMGFICHLVIEKAFKAVISEHGTVPPKTHALGKLAEIAGVLDQLTEEQKRVMTTLNTMQIEGRYQEYKNALAANLTKGASSKLLRSTTELLSWIKSKIES